MATMSTKTVPIEPTFTPRISIATDHNTTAIRTDIHYTNKDINDVDVSEDLFSGETDMSRIQYKYKHPRFHYGKASELITLLPHVAVKLGEGEIKNGKGVVKLDEGVVEHDEGVVELGRGTNNVVYKVKDRLDVYYVLRVNNSKATARQQFIMNVKKYLSLQQEGYSFIIPLLYAETFKSDCNMAPTSCEGDNIMIMPYIAGKTLDKYEANSLEYGKVLNIISQLKTALNDMSVSGYVHRDIKPGNIFYSEEDEKVYIIDFDTLCKTTNGSCINLNDQIIGTRNYARPNSIKGDKHYTYTTNYDKWSLGYMIYTNLYSISKGGKSDLHNDGQALMDNFKTGGGLSKKRNTKKRRPVKRTRYTRRMMKIRSVKR